MAVFEKAPSSRLFFAIEKKSKWRAPVFMISPPLCARRLINRHLSAADLLQARLKISEAGSLAPRRAGRLAGFLRPGSFGGAL